MSERDAFIAAILAEPADDTPRLAFADWLDEQGDGEMSLRAWWIRHMITTRTTKAWDGDAIKRSIDIVQGCPAGSRLPRRILWGPYQLLGTTEQWWSFGRGFVDEVRLSAAAFLGGRVCGDCGEPDDEWFGFVRPPGNSSSYVPCLKCHGAGHLPGLAAAIFKAHPVTRVVLTGMEPYSDERGWFWSMHSIEAERERGERYPHALPERLCDAGVKLASAVWNSSGDALSAASELCVRYGRRAAGLPPCPGLAAWRTTPVAAS